MDLVPAKGGKAYDFRTNIPKEFFMRHNALLKKIHSQHLKKRMKKMSYIEKVGQLILLNFHAESFYFPEELLMPDNQSIYSETFKSLLKLAGGFTLKPEYYTWHHKPIHYHVLQRKLALLKEFRKEEFEADVLACSREEFEKQIDSPQCQHEYVESFASSNKHFVCVDQTAIIYILMTSKEEPLMFLTVKK